MIKSQNGKRVALAVAFVVATTALTGAGAVTAMASPIASHVVTKDSTGKDFTPTKAQRKALLATAKGHESVGRAHAVGKPSFIKWSNGDYSVVWNAAGADAGARIQVRETGNYRYIETSLF